MASYRAAATMPGPARGWLRAVRQASGVSSGQVAERIGASRQLVAQQEKAEAEGRITLKSLRELANALDCELAYALVPRSGSLRALEEDRARAQARENVLRVEHTMALEGQASGNLSQAITAESRRILAKRAAR